MKAPTMTRLVDLNNPALRERLENYSPKPFVYIRCPISRGDVLENCRRALELAHALIQDGRCAPYCPVQIGLNLISRFTHDQWMDHDLSILAIASAVVAIPGPSVGGDIEEAYARGHDIPWFWWPNHVNQFRTWLDTECQPCRRPFSLPLEALVKQSGSSAATPEIPNPFYSIPTSTDLLSSVGLKDSTPPNEKSLPSTDRLDTVPSKCSKTT